jgi:carbohydrate kinase (thermoresistant glucokinase family)
MGVSGSGKTVIGSRLAARLKLPFYDADDFHSPQNIKKMKSGTPLTDQDRYPWLEGLADEMKQWSRDGGAILACSALKEEYRQVLASRTTVDWICLHGSFETIYERMKERDHFMNPQLLQSQFDTLELPSYGLHLDVLHTPAETVSRIVSLMNQNE